MRHTVKNPYEDKIPAFHGVAVDVRAFDYGWCSDVEVQIKLADGREHFIGASTSTLAANGAVVHLGTELVVALADLVPETGAEILTALVGRAIAPLVEPHYFWGILEKILYKSIKSVAERHSYGIRAAWWLLIEGTIHQDALEHIGHGIEHPAAGRKGSIGTKPAESRVSNS